MMGENVVKEYIKDKDFELVELDWDEAVDTIEDAVFCMESGDFVQPLKPYLRFGDSENRIIAMPAYIGKEFEMAGIKWIASFPSNRKSGNARANSVLILNDAGTGKPLAIMNTAYPSIIRTAAVSGVLIKRYVKSREKRKVKIGVIGFGPIGRNHVLMCDSILHAVDAEYYVYDVEDVERDGLPGSIQDKITLVGKWEDAYKNCDIVITCTTSRERYIDKKPLDGSLLLNVSLRDYKKDIFEYVKSGIIVDQWEEVCRENTDIEQFSFFCGLKKENTCSIIDVVCGNLMDKLAKEQTVMFNPMGMAVFDIAIGKYLLYRFFS